MVVAGGGAGGGAACNSGSGGGGGAGGFRENKGTRTPYTGSPLNGGVRYTSHSNRLSNYSRWWCTQLFQLHGRGGSGVIQFFQQ